MEVIADKSFERDFKKLEPDIKRLVAEAYDFLLATTDITTLLVNPSITKMVDYKNCYRFRIGNFRIGMYEENKILYLSRVLNRKEIYKYFPSS